MLVSSSFLTHPVAWIGGYAFSLLDMAPDYVGVLQGINNTIGLAPGFIMPVVISAMTPNVSRVFRHRFTLTLIPIFCFHLGKRERVESCVYLVWKFVFLGRLNLLSDGQFIAAKLGQSEKRTRRTARRKTCWSIIMKMFSSTCYPLNNGSGLL